MFSLTSGVCAEKLSSGGQSVNQITAWETPPRCVQSGGVHEQLWPVALREQRADLGISLCRLSGCDSTQN